MLVVLRTFRHYVRISINGEMEYIILWGHEIYAHFHVTVLIHTVADSASFLHYYFYYFSNQITHVRFVWERLLSKTQSGVPQVHRS